MHAFHEAQINYQRYANAATKPIAPKYRPRAPEKTVLYQIVQDNLETMLAEACEFTEHGFGYPQFIEKEYRKYLDCGQYHRGFCRIRCKSCGYEQLLAFSCKARICPSCHARRMHDLAYHLEENVLPHVPYRQWVWTLPRQVRYLLARDKKLLAAIHKIFVRTIFNYQRRLARADGFNKVYPGAISFVQLFGGFLNANCHFHSLIPDGVFVSQPEQKLLFVEFPYPQRKDIEQILCKLASKVKRHINKYLEAKGFDIDENDPLKTALAKAVQMKLPTISKNDDSDHQTENPNYCCANYKGYSLHADVFIEAKDRKALLRLIRYGARQSFSQKQLSLLDNGKVQYQLKRPYGPQRITYLTLDQTELLHRLAALMPRPYLNLTRYAGVFAPNANLRHEVCPGLRSKNKSVDQHHTQHKGQNELSSEIMSDLPLQCAETKTDPYRLPWSELLRRTFKEEVLQCPKCNGPLTVIAFITQSLVISKILKHLGLPDTPPKCKPARLPEQIDLDWDELSSDNQDCQNAYGNGNEFEDYARGPP